MPRHQLILVTVASLGYISISDTPNRVPTSPQNGTNAHKSGAQEGELHVYGYDDATSHGYGAELRTESLVEVKTQA